MPRKDGVKKFFASNKNQRKRRGRARESRRSLQLNESSKSPSQ
jgi:hypothetical protein